MVSKNKKSYKSKPYNKDKGSWSKGNNDPLNKQSYVKKILTHFYYDIMIKLVILILLISVEIINLITL